MNNLGLEPKIQAGTLIRSKYRVTKQLGAGSFGEVWHAINLKTGEDVALKFERFTTNPFHQQLQFEHHIYQKLKGVGFAQVKGFFFDSGYQVLVMQLLGPSLQDLLEFCRRSFSLKTVLMLAEQLILRIQTLHECNYIHRDIKPDNFVAGIGKDCDTIYLIDLGLAKKYRYYRKHCPLEENNSLIGTARYSSINALKGISQSRRDDLESLGYVLVYLLKGSLPWQGLTAAKKSQKYEKILEVKMSTSLETLCHGLPEEFIIYLQYCRQLGFEENPNYAHLKQLFSDLFYRSKFTLNYKFDWKILHGKKASDRNTAPYTPIKQSTMPATSSRKRRYEE